MQERKNYVEVNYKPYLFFVVFGVTGDDLEVSASRHHVDSLPGNLDIRSLNRAEHASYIDGFFAGDLGMVLGDENPELLSKCRAADTCVIINGQIEDDRNLDYMRNIIGIVKAFTDKGAVGVLDLLTFSLYSPEDWENRFFEKEINAQNHVLILVSGDEDGCWLHTRGMLEFGRPDLSIHGVAEEEIADCKAILDQMIFYSGEGVFFNGIYNLHAHNGKTYSVTSRFVEDFENDDFNNAYCNVEIQNT